MPSPPHTEAWLKSRCVVCHRPLPCPEGIEEEFLPPSAQGGRGLVANTGAKATYFLKEPHGPPVSFTSSCSSARGWTRC